MQQRSIFLNIILWCELIIAARLLMFTLPVLIGKYSQGSLVLVSIADWTIFSLTIIGFFYLLTAIASLAGLKGWKLFHYLGVILTVALTLSLIKKVVSVYETATIGYYVPAAVSLVLVLLVSFSKGKSTPAAQ